MKSVMMIVLLMGLTAGAADYSVTVPVTNSYKIAPARDVKTAIAWTAETAITQGSTRMGQNRRLYMALHAGSTSTTSPSHNSGTAVDGTVTWLAINSLPRQQISISQGNDGETWYRDSSVTNGGVFTYLKGQIYTDTSDAAVFVGCESNTVFYIRDR